MTTVLVSDEAYWFTAGPFWVPDTGVWHGSMLHEVIRLDMGVLEEMGEKDKRKHCVEWPVDKPLKISVVQHRDDIGVPAADVKMAITRIERLLHCFRKQAHRNVFQRRDNVVC